MAIAMAALRRTLAALVAVVLCAGCSDLPSLSEVGENPWQRIDMPTDAALVDLAFTRDADRGWAVGNSSAILETRDGGDSWQPRELELEAQQFSFTAVSFSGNEGWIAGSPSILLHTEDGGDTWFRIPLSEKLPGSPYSVTALGPGQAEMVTDVGAIYQTQDGGRNWQARVEETVGVVRNISRSPEGRYVAVSARGNFYSTWAPGQTEWQAHERTSSRRIQNMGYGKDGRMWLLARGGQIQFSEPGDFESWNEPQYPEFSASWGLLDVGYRTPEELWVAGGSANLLCSFDDGASWQKDRQVEDIPANFYRIVFLSPERGFILGNDGVLLKYRPQAAAS